MSAPADVFSWVADQDYALVGAYISGSGGVSNKEELVFNVPGDMVVVEEPFMLSSGWNYSQLNLAVPKGSLICFNPDRNTQGPSAVTLFLEPLVQVS